MHPFNYVSHINEFLNQIDICLDRFINITVLNQSLYIYLTFDIEELTLISQNAALNESVFLHSTFSYHFTNHGRLEFVNASFDHWIQDKHINSNLGNYIVKIKMDNACTVQYYCERKKYCTYYSKCKYR